ncbi:MAG: threonylcarbamoyl-AMP synthase [Clostridia bacterium]|nr:threonylcarbamoyl-AMP synthase [Clostridia bacterium]
MKSKYLDMQDVNDYSVLDEAANIINNGGLVLFPTETVYGIGANAFDDEAVKKIFIAKGRAQDNPLILHISDMEMLDEIAENISELEYKLMETFWPGPFTIILNKKKNIANQATCNGDTVGVRMPSNRIAYELIKRANVPIAAPSANISGRPSGTNIDDIIEELEDKVDYMINGGETEIGLESTVVRIIENEIVIFRPGRITKEDLLKVAESVNIDKNIMKHIANDEKVLSPGMKYRHYAPKTDCKLVYNPDNDKLVEEILSIAQANKNVLIVCTTENIEKFKEYSCIDMGSKNDLLQISHNLFSILRDIDRSNANLAIIEGVKAEGIGLAIMNRLIRACEL